MADDTVQTLGSDVREAMAVLRDMPIQRDAADGVPRVLDIELGRRLGYERPRDIRRVIARCIKDGMLSDYAVRADPARTSAGPKGGRVAREYWLGRKSAFMVTGQASTPRAKVFQVAVMEVFDLFVQGKLVPNELRATPAIERYMRPIGERMKGSLWTVGCFRAICALYGNSACYTPGGKPPQFMATIHALIYRLVLGTEVAAEAKRRCAEASSDAHWHEFLTDAARAALSRAIDRVEDLAWQYTNPADIDQGVIAFKRRLEEVFQSDASPQPSAQLGLWAQLQEPLSSNDKKRRARREARLMGAQP